MTADSIATTVATTKRPPNAVGGKVGSPENQITSGLFIVPLMPVNAETVNTDILESPREGKETYVFSDENNVLPDIVEGDILVVSGTEYIIRSAAEWPRPEGGSYLHLIVEEQKGNA